MEKEGIYMAHFKQHKTKIELLLVFATVFAIAACSGGLKKSGASNGAEVEENVVIDLLEDRSLGNSDLKTSKRSLLEIPGSEDGSDVQNDNTSTLGAELLGNINLLSANFRALEEVNTKIDEIIQELLENDISSANELRRSEESLRSQAKLLTASFKSVAACFETVVANKEESKRVVIDKISPSDDLSQVISAVTFQDFEKVETQGDFDESLNVAYVNSNKFKRFVYLLVNEKNELISFQTLSKVKPTAKTVVGTGTVNVEYRNPENGEEPTFVKGETSYSVNELKSSFVTPASVIDGHFSVALCVETKEGNFEHKVRNVFVRNVEAPVKTPSPEATSD